MRRRLNRPYRAGTGDGVCVDYRDLEIKEVYKYAIGPGGKR